MGRIKRGLSPIVSLLSPGMASIINIPILRPSLYRHEVGNHIKFTRLHLGSLALRPISLSFRNSRPLITQTPLLRTTKAYGQLLGRDFNPLAKLLLLRTSVPYCPPCERLTPLFGPLCLMLARIRLTG